MISDSQFRMSTDVSSSVQSNRDSKLAVVDSAPLVTIFGIPKPFVGHEGIIQRNALKSWAALGEQVEIILFGDEIGTSEYANEIGARHIPELGRNGQGTPLLNEAFHEANIQGRGEMIVYANCDILFVDDLLSAVERAWKSEHAALLLIGRRIDLDLTHMVDFESASWRDELLGDASSRGKLAPVVCKDYFIFRKGQYAEIPAFAIGRGNWDNWVVHRAISSKIPVIDCTAQITAIHQNHSYQHLQNGRLEAYVKGQEAEENRRLAGGRHLVTGCAATWRMTGSEIAPRRRPISSAFLGDLPRFATLLRDLFVKR